MNSRAVFWNYESDEARTALQQRTQFVHALRLHRQPFIDEVASAAIFCELITNVMRHTPGPIRIFVYNDGGSDVSLRVEDDGAMFSLDPRLPKNAADECGRGLFIAAQYAKQLHLERNPAGGKAIIAILPHAARTPMSS